MSQPENPQGRKPQKKPPRAEQQRSDDKGQSCAAVDLETQALRNNERLQRSLRQMKEHERGEWPDRFDA